MNKPFRIFLTLPLFVCIIFSHAQSYHAINGSPYAGSNSRDVNPASTINSAYKWDLTLFSAQITVSNSSMVIYNASLLNYDSANTQLTNGNGNRYFHSTFDISLFNFRMNLDKKSAFGFGLRGRMYNHEKSMPFFYNDTIVGLNSFLQTNNATPYFQGYATHSGWIEADINYARLLIDNNHQKLSIGITLGLQKGVSGAYGNIQRISYSEQLNNATNANEYLLTGGSVTASYSSNYDLINNANSITPSVIKSFLNDTRSSLNANIGIEYLVKDITVDANPLNNTNYDWKFGFSIMDIGKNIFNPAGGSFTASLPGANVNDTVLINQISNAGSLSKVRDTLSHSFNVIDSLRSPFTISNPTRIILSADKNVGNHFYVNGELSLNLFSTAPQTNLKTREINLVTITPRWEKKNIGIYLPVQYNTQGQLWIGGAAKLGPLLIGVHSLDFYKWFKTGTQTLNGGFYIMLNIHPFGSKEKEPECPPY